MIDIKVEDITKDLERRNRQTTKEYMDVAQMISLVGYRDGNRTGVDTLKVPQITMNFDLSDGYVPIIDSKKVFWRTAVEELLWIYRDASNDVTLLNDKGIHIWDQWVNANNTIGKAYGYQIAKYDQLNNLIKTLREDPQSRRMIMNLWNIEDLPEMELQPCCFMTMWDVTEGYLNCTLVQRSGDYLVGVPFNMTQYAVLVHLIAHVTGLKPGCMLYVINNAHIYENQLETFDKMLMDYDLGDDVESAPRIILDESVKEFKDFDISNINIEGYKANRTYQFEVVK